MSVLPVIISTTTTSATHIYRFKVHTWYVWYLQLW